MGKIQQALRKADDVPVAGGGAATAGGARLGHGLQRLDADPRLVFVRDPESEAAAQFRGLRDNVMTLVGQSGYRVLTVSDLVSWVRYP